MSKLISVNSVRLTELLGKGGFGQVYAGIVSPQGDVAVKVIDCESTADLLGLDDWEELRNYLFAEGERLSAAEHANVVRVFSVGYSDSQSQVYIVVERCDRSLFHECRQGPVPLATAKTAIAHSLRGLEALHLRGMVHRDIKPGNILVKGPTYKIGDFGLVTDNLIHGYASRQGYTEHLAPEVFEVGVTSPVTDVWAMGITAFRVLNGEPWYEEMLNAMGIDRRDFVDTAHRLEEIVTSGRFSARLRWMPHVPKSWRRLVNKALHVEPAKRYRDGGQMLSAMSSLDVPDSPSWACSYSNDRIVWMRRTGDREEIVEWQRHAPNKNQYTAFTRPVGPTGKRFTLARSNGVLSRSSVLEALQNFFRTRS